MRGQRALFWVEAGLATLTGFLAVLTALWRGWIEAIFRVDPDEHSGSLEWVVVVVLLLATSILVAAACGEWRPRERAVRSLSG
jgi:hypothetical protein